MLAAASRATAAGVAGGSLIASARWIHSLASRRCPVSSQNHCSVATDRQADSMSPVVMLWVHRPHRDMEPASDLAVTQPLGDR